MLVAILISWLISAADAGRLGTEAQIRSIGANDAERRSLYRNRSAILLVGDGDRVLVMSQEGIRLASVGSALAKEAVITRVKPRFRPVYSRSMASCFYVLDDGVSVELLSVDDLAIRKVIECREPVESMVLSTDEDFLMVMTSEMIHVIELPSLESTAVDLESIHAAWGNEDETIRIT